MQLSILPVKEYNVSKDSKEKEKDTASASFLSYLQGTQKNSEKKKDAELTNVVIPSPTGTTLPLKTDQSATGTLVDSAEKKVGLQSLVKNQGSSVALEKSLDLHLQSQVIKQIVSANNMSGQEENPGFQQLSQTITTDSMASKKLDMNVIDSGKINSLRSNESLLHKQVSSNNVVMTSSLVKGTMESKEVSNRAEKAYSVQSPVQSQAGMKELNKALDALPNVLEQSSVVISKGKAIENQLESSMPNQAIRLNKQESGIVNSLVSSEGSTSKVPNMGISESVLQKQISSSEIAVTSSPLSMRTSLLKTEQKFRDATDVNHEKPTVEITQAPAERVNPINQLNVLMQNSQNAAKSKENNDMSNNSSPNQDQVGSSNQVVSNGITIPNVQATKSFDSIVTPSIPSTVSAFAQDLVSTFSSRIHVAETSGKMEATLSLNPDDLGKVDVKVVIQDGHVSAKLITDSSIGRAALEQHVDSLYAALQQQGLQVDKINITQHSSSSLPSSFSQGGDSAPKQGQQQSRRRGDSYGETEEYSDAPYESEWVSQINTMA
ncbi:flagellar hook-length control protein FliK [Ectobacillus sp. sgz5001026]|uniref:flagellar hook-length control protein FliK n=1 Tax=Ectobacillus sp. sgz5001026 TaxID=3242473 RepID=UPI0036D220FF